MIGPKIIFSYIWGALICIYLTSIIIGINYKYSCDTSPIIEKGFPTFLLLFGFSNLLNYIVLFALMDHGSILSNKSAKESIIILIVICNLILLVLGIIIISYIDPKCIIPANTHIIFTITMSCLSAVLFIINTVIMACSLPTRPTATNQAVVDIPSVQIDSMSDPNPVLQPELNEIDKVVPVESTN